VYEISYNKQLNIAEGGSPTSGCPQLKHRTVPKKENNFVVATKRQELGETLLCSVQLAHWFAK
jgi:hypothetical protein